jgi:hypothetical protein
VDDLDRGPNFSKTMVQGMFSHIRAITGGDFWGRSVNPSHSHGQRRAVEDRMNEDSEER